MHKRNKLILVFLIISLIIMPLVYAGPIKDFVTGKGESGFWGITKNIFMGSWLKDKTNIELAVRVMFFLAITSALTVRGEDVSILMLPLPKFLTA